MSERNNGFRVGESIGRPIGGNVADKPLSQVLHAFALSRGLESQLAFAKSLKIRQGIVSNWLRGRTIPSSIHMASIFEVHSPTPEEVESLIEPWNLLLQTKTDRRAGKRVKQSNNPLGRYLEQFSLVHKISLNEINERLGYLGNSSNLRNTAGIDSMKRTIERAPQALGLDETETAQLVEAIAQTIEQKVANGHKFKSNPQAAKNAQKDLACVTYTPIQAAGELGVSREAIRQKRKKLGLPLLMTEEQMDLLKQKFEANKDMRERMIKTKMARSNKDQ